MAHHTFAYSRPGVFALLVVCICLASIALMFARFAMQAETASVLSVQLPAQLIEFACWIAVAGVGALAVTAIRHWANRQSDPRAVEVDEHEAFIPDFSAGAGFLRVRHADILSIHEDKNSEDDRSLIVVTRHGQSQLQLSAFENKAQYLEFVRLIKSYWKPPPA